LPAQARRVVHGRGRSTGWGYATVGGAR
jgi:hypothetical protein